LKWTARSPIAHAFHPPQASNIPPNFRRHKQGRRSVPRPIRRTQRGLRRLIVIWLIFWTRIDGPIWSSYHDSARVSNPPAGRILPRICTPINGAATSPPCPNRTTPEYHDVDHGVAVGQPRQFYIIAPIAFEGGTGGWCCWTCAGCVCGCVEECCYFLFHVNKVQQCA
jgi:hypothetical protein